MKRVIAPSERKRASIGKALLDTLNRDETVSEVVADKEEIKDDIVVKEPEPKRVKQIKAKEIVAPTIGGKVNDYAHHLIYSSTDKDMAERFEDRIMKIIYFLYENTDDVPQLSLQMFEEQLRDIARQNIVRVYKLLYIVEKYASIDPPTETELMDVDPNKFTAAYKEINIYKLKELLNDFLDGNYHDKKTFNLLEEIFVGDSRRMFKPSLGDDEFEIEYGFRVFRQNVTFKLLNDLIDRIDLTDDDKDIPDVVQRFRDINRPENTIMGDGVDLDIPANVYTTIDRLYQNLVTTIVKDVLRDMMSNYRLIEMVSGFLESDSTRDLLNFRFEKSIIDLMLMSDNLIPKKMVKRFSYWLKLRKDNIAEGAAQEGEEQIDITQFNTKELFGFFLGTSQESIENDIRTNLSRKNLYSTVFENEINNPERNASRLFTTRMMTAYSRALSNIKRLTRQYGKEITTKAIYTDSNLMLYFAQFVAAEIVFRRMSEKKMINSSRFDTNNVNNFYNRAESEMRIALCDAGYRVGSDAYADILNGL